MQLRVRARVRVHVMLGGSSNWNACVITGRTSHAGQSFFPPGFLRWMLCAESVAKSRCPDIWALRMRWGGGGGGAFTFGGREFCMASGVFGAAARAEAGFVVVGIPGLWDLYMQLRLGQEHGVIGGIQITIGGGNAVLLCMWVQVGGAGCGRRLPCTCRPISFASHCGAPMST